MGTNKKACNFLVKLDTDSLSTSMEVVSENPKVNYPEQAY